MNTHSKTEHTVIYTSLIINALMFLTALSLLITVYITGNDPFKRLTSHYATMALSLLPIIYFFIKKSKTNAFMFAFYTLYVLLAVFLGTSLNFYNQFEWLHYDKLIHVLFGYSAALLSLFILVKTKKLDTLSIGLILLFCFSFSMMTGGIWEIFEFTSDKLIQTTSQGKPVLTTANQLVVDVGETMFDIIADFIGAVLFTIHLYFYNRKKSGLMRFMIDQMSK